jgi:hypothetical protein
MYSSGRPAGHKCVNLTSRSGWLRKDSTNETTQRLRSPVSPLEMYRRPGNRSSCHFIASSAEKSGMLPTT